MDTEDAKKKMAEALQGFSVPGKKEPEVKLNRKQRRDMERQRGAFKPEKKGYKTRVDKRSSV